MILAQIKNVGRKPITHWELQERPGQRYSMIQVQGSRHEPQEPNEPAVQAPCLWAHAAQDVERQRRVGERCLWPE